MAELLTRGGVGFGFAASRFAEADGLGADAQTGAVHQRHHVFDQTEAAFAHDLARGVGELEFASRRTLDTHLVLDAAHGHAAVGLVEHEVRQATAVGTPLFAAGQHEVQVGVTVGDETLHAVQAPAAGRFVVGGLQAHRLQVAARVGLGEVHRAGGTLADAGQIFVFQGIGAEFLDGVGAVGEPPDGGEAHVGAGDHLGHHHDHGTRQVESVILALQRDAVETGLDEDVEIATGTGRVLDAAVGQRRTHVIDFFRIGSDHIAGDFTQQFQDPVVLVDRLFGGSRRFGMHTRLGKIFFFYCDHLSHLRMTEMKRETLVIGIEVHIISDYSCNRP